MRLLVSVITALAAFAVSMGACPDVKKLRSTRVSEDFDPSKVQGLWYQPLYQDLAQIGASCPRLDVSFSQATGVLTAPFSVKYWNRPFSITELYTPKAERGHYIKTVQAPGGLPGGNLIPIDVAVVDVSASLSDNRYETMILYGCAQLLVPIIEIQFFTRSPDFNATMLESMKSKARSLGVAFSEGDLKKADYEGCSAATELVL